ncbi:MAG: non-ribosomal peptide synthetase [Acidobacteria bacterium]|nr:non-ribosomal peptide synthetase [Acidobacteriota bacterium]
MISDFSTNSPSALAVHSGPDSLTYEQLDSRSDQLANYLVSLGVGPEIPVGLCLDRSISQVIGALAILKAGGAYLPLDPANPRDRLQEMLRDAQVSVVLAERAHAEKTQSEKWKQIFLDSDWGEISRCPKQQLPDSTSPDQLAYLIYTSGSTGKPKGVEISHGSLQNLVSWHRETFGITSADRATLLSNPGFDASVWELWPYLASGASVHLPNNDIRVSAELLRDSVVATSGIVASSNNGDLLPPIGRPITNTSAFVLDESHRPVKDGESGELYIVGPGLARGYRNNPELTAQRFIPNPFSSSPGDRLFKTGDLVRRLPDGQIAFIGRLDDQVKIRGYRIEPNEITSVLARHPGVQACAVIAREDCAGGKRLVGYVVPSTNADLTVAALQQFLKSSLPDYMIPTSFVSVESLPLTANGKVDRTALAAPNSGNSFPNDEIVPPSSPTEQRVSEILARLLHTDQVGKNDNFFLLGGHSLLGTQLIARVHDTFGVELTLRALFDHPTVTGIASEIELLLVAKLEAMSDEEVQRVLSESSQPGA